MGDLNIARGLPLAGLLGRVLTALSLTGLCPGPRSPFAAFGGDQAGVGQFADDLLDGRLLGLVGD